MAEKTCRKCDKTKPTSEFRRNPPCRDGLSSWCAECHREATRRWRAEHREEINARRRVVPPFVYEPGREYAPNPDPRPKARVW
jgi:hypothetical protein